MAFCPNCGTPNTDQADKCVSCSFELTKAPKPKFKGTMMMSPGSVPKVPSAPIAPTDPAPPPAATGASPHSSVRPAAGGKNMAFAKTMMGPAGGFDVAPPPVGAFAPPPADLAGTVQASPPPPVSSSHSFQQPAAAPPQTRQPSTNFGRSTGAEFDSDPPPRPKTNTGKILAIGCATVLVLSCVIGIALYSLVKEKIQGLMSNGPDLSGQAREWQTALSQSLSQIAAVCQSDCQNAAVYFHPQAHAALAEASKLRPIHVTQLSEGAEAVMLAGSEDAHMADELGLDPARCVRLALGKAKVIGCSVPEPGGEASLRVITLSGLDTL